MKVKMKDDLVQRYKRCLPEELNAQEDYMETIKFLKSIESKEVELVFNEGDAFEKKENNTWLPSPLWDEVK